MSEEPTRITLGAVVEVDRREQITELVRLAANAEVGLRILDDGARPELHLSTASSTYVTNDDRFVVMLAASCGESEGDDDPGVHDPVEAAARAFSLTRDLGSLDTQWIVLDRETGQVQVLEQDDFEDQPTGLASA